MSTKLPQSHSRPHTQTHRATADHLLDTRGYSGSSIRGQNPAHLLEKPVRERIIDCYYFREQCFGLNEATLCDRAEELTSIGGSYGDGASPKPSPFLCLVFKLLQLQPERAIVLEYLHQRELKYLTALAAFYVRLTFDSKDVYGTLEPLLEDLRKLRHRTKAGVKLTFVDQFVDDLLTKDRVCGTSLWKLKRREDLEIGERSSPLAAELDSGSEDDEHSDHSGDGRDM